MGKLVRDRVPEIIAAEKRTPNVRVLKDHDYDVALLDKLLEEVAELRSADPAKRLDEAADIYEVLLAILSTQDMSAEDLESAANEKRRARGAFTQRWWWEAD